VTKVTTNITHIETATGEKMSLTITTLVTSLVSIFLAFFKCWELSLIMMATLPALVIVGIFFFKSLQLNSQREKISYEKASSRTEQALGQIRTVKGMVG
jgi:ATP-binding cassette, subfamily B (MDR/TAP), member 1